MPVFSCGGMRYQQSWNPDDEISDENQINLSATIRRAMELGINHIETARGYGTSEEQLGRVLPSIERDKLILQTKGSPKEDPNEFRANFFDSLKRLKMDYVDLFGLHGINNEEVLEWSIRKDGCLAEARKLQNEGYIRHVGFSTHAEPETIVEAICHEEDGGFDYVNLHWYYIYQRNTPALIEAAKRDMGVFIISPTNKGGNLHEPSDKFRNICEPLHPVVFNGLFCLSRPEIHTISIGASCPTDFDTQMGILDHLEESPREIETITQRLDREWIETLGADFAEHYREGLPNWSDTPGELNIPVLLWLRNLVHAYDMVDYGKSRYDLMGDGGHWFPGQKIEEFDDQEIAALCVKSPFSDRIPALLHETKELFTPKK